MNKENMIYGISGIFGLIVNRLWGGWDSALSTLLLFMLLDYCLGLACGSTRKELSSSTAFSGILKKVAILSIIAVATKVDVITTADGYLRMLVLFFYIAQEAISIIENAAVLGVPIPEKLKDSLIQLQEGNKKDITNRKEH